jgi:hypothetical protein
MRSESARQAVGRETDSGSERGGVPVNPCDMPWASGSGDRKRLATEASNLPSTNHVSAELPSEAIARRTFAPTFGAVSPGRAESSGDAPQDTENHETKPPTSGKSGEADATGHAKARQKRPLTEIAERVAGLAVLAKSDNESVLT